MKKQAFITILLTVLMSMPMFAYDFTYGNINYNIVDNNSVEVTWGNYSGDIYIYGSVYYNGKSYSVTGIGYEAFCEETKVVYVSLPSTVTYISNSAFENTRITNMTIPNSVKSIGRSAFSYCSKLTTVTIPNSVTSIGENVFYNCSNLTTIISENTNPFDIKDNVFPDLIYSTATLVVPSGTRSAYQSKAGWKKFKNIVEFGEKRTIHVATAGTLSNYISTDEKYEIEDLTLTGYLNGTDIRLIRAMAGTTSHGRTHRDPYVDYSSTNGKLKHLNLLNANIVKGGDGYITIPEWEDPEYTFHGTCTEDCYSYLYTVNNSISYKMFYLTKLESLILPNSVTSIDKSAFYSCSNLTSIIVGSGNTRYDSRDNCNAIIEKSSNTLIAGCKNSTIPNSVTRIGDGAFYECSGLTSITIPNSVTSIGENVFYNCSSLTTIVSERTNPFDINERVFLDLTYTTAKLVVPPGTKSVYQSKSGWKKFTNIVEYKKKRSIHVETAGTLPNLIEDYEKYLIEELTLTGEMNGKDIRFIRNMSGIDWYLDCPTCTLSEAYDIFTAGKLKVLDISNAKIVSGGGSFYESGGSDSRPTDSYFTKDNAISDYMFCRCNLTSIKLPNSVTYIGRAFSGCSGLTSVTIGNSVTSIGGYAFYGCSGLTSITIPSSVTSIGSNAFSGCSSLNAVRISDLAAWCNIDFLCDEGKYDYLSNPLVYANHLYLNDSKVEELVIPDGVTEIKAGAFFSGNDITSVTIPNSVTSIGHNSFAYCNLSSLTIPNSVTYVGYGSFKFNQNLTSVAIPNSVTFIGGWAFGGCNALTSVTIPNSVTEILESTFDDCSGLISVTIPSSVTSIGSNAFSGCSSLNAVRISDLAAWCNIDFFCDEGKYDYLSNPLVYANHLYLNDSEVKSLVIPDGVTEIKAGAFFSGNDITSVTIPNGVTSIGHNSFAYCNLSSLTIPNSVTYVGCGSFKFNQNMTSVNIPNSVTFIGGWAFGGCCGLTSVTIPNSVTEICESTFDDCSGLISVTIPSSVTSIGSYAFRYCKGLTSIISLNNAPPAYSNDSFDNTKFVVWVPRGSVNAYKQADGWKDFQNIRELMFGDLNIDFEVNQADLDATVDFILDKDPEGFYESLADLNGDDKVDAADVVKLVTILNLQDGLSMDYQAKYSNQVISSLSCTLNNDGDKSIQLTKCELYFNESLAGSSKFKVTLASGGSKKCSFDELESLSSRTGFSVVWYYTYNGEEYTYRCEITE